MSLSRLTRADWIAWLAALALLFVMAMDWWSNALGDDARQTESVAPTGGAESGEIGRQVEETARLTAEAQERNAWDPVAAIDGVILIVLLLAIAWTLAAVIARAMGRRYDVSLAAVAGATAAVGAALVAYRIVQEPGVDSITTVKIGAPLAVLCAAALALANSSAMSNEREPAEAADEPPAAEDPPAAEEQPAPEPAT